MRNRPTILYDKLYASQTVEYASWQRMKDRCLNPKNNKYAQYGGRNIKIYQPWLNFYNFYKDMGKRPHKTYSIDRINNNGGYSPNNCRWADKTTQNINQRKRIDNSSGFIGVDWYKEAKKYRARINLHKESIWLGLFTTPEEAALVYDSASIQLHDTNAKLNFTDWTGAEDEEPDNDTD